MTDILDPIIAPAAPAPATDEAPTRRSPRTFEVRLPVGVIDADGDLRRDVVIRKMTGREEAILADKKYQRNGGKLVTELLTACVETVGGQPVDRAVLRSMTSVDRNFLLLKLRSVTFGSELDARYQCPACGHTDEVTEDLDELPVRDADGAALVCDIDLEDGFVDREGNAYFELRLRLPDGQDEEAVASQIRENASSGKNALLGRCIVSLGDLPRPKIDAMGSKILADLTLSDRRLIDQRMADGAPGVDLSRHLDCVSCGHEYVANLDLSNFLSLA